MQKVLIGGWRAEKRAELCERESLGAGWGLGVWVCDGSKECPDEVWGGVSV